MLLGELKVHLIVHEVHLLKIATPPLALVVVIAMVKPKSFIHHQTSSSHSGPKSQQIVARLVRAPLGM
ncbi:unnamed protein product [Sphenostylis stenocarpa]|uniref:Uncharacterized protein n=1 Tax=Sphenostylis stenocarpa TaxID=92480 RepID=A0AA86VHY2_9FABA|nr:unnamed protein product [Sphenostylis stenocarpa]